MVGYVTLGTRDLERAEAFYEPLLADLGAECLVKNERMRFYGKPEQPMLAICLPFDGKAASVGNGTMVALKMESREAVKEFHAKALRLGATDEGAPGERGFAFYGGYFRDPDGNKLAVFILGN